MLKAHSRSAQVAFLVLGGLISQGGAILSAALIARHLSVESYGTVRQTLFVYSLLIPIITGSIPVTLLYYIPRASDEQARRRLAHQTLAILAVAGIVIGAGVLGSADLIAARFHNPDLAQALRVSSCYPLLSLAGAWYSPYCIATGKAAFSTRYSVLSSGLLLLAAVVARGLPPDPTNYLIIFALATAVASAVAVGTLGRLQSTAGTTQTVSIKSQIGYALPLGLGSIVSVWGLRIDQAIIASKFSVSDYAIYSAGALELPIVSLVSSSIFAVLLPEISRLFAAGEREEALRLWKSAVEKSMAILFPVFGAAFILAVPLSIGLYGMRYVASAAVFSIYLLYVPVRTISFGLLLRAAGRTRYDLTGSIAFLLMNAGTSILLARLLGLYGPAVAAVLSTYALAAYFVLATKKELGVGPRALLIPDKLVPTAALALAPAIVLWFGFGLKLMTPVAIWRYLAAGAIYMVTVATLYVTTGKWQVFR